MLRIGVLASHEGTTLQAILDAGASVHLVDAEYDTGAVVCQERIQVLPGDTVESLKARVRA